MAYLTRMIFGSGGVALYWYFARRLLYHAMPVFVDGSGTMVSFYWGANQPAAYPEIGYSYLVAASILTLLGCATVWFVSRRQGGRLRTFLLSSAVTFAVYSAAVMASDVGTKYHIWSGPTAFGWGGPTHLARSYQPFLYVIISLSLIAGLFALALSLATQRRTARASR
jgi:hypothetical protein